MIETGNLAADPPNSFEPWSRCRCRGDRRTATRLRQRVVVGCRAHEAVRDQASRPHTLEDEPDQLAGRVVDAADEVEDEHRVGRSGADGDERGLVDGAAQRGEEGGSSSTWSRFVPK